MPEMSLSEWYKSGGHLPPETSDPIPDAPSFGMRDIFAMSGMPRDKADALANQYRPEAKMKKGGKADDGQAFPLQDDFAAEMERRRNRPRTRAGVPVEDTNVLGGALGGLGEMFQGAARGYGATMLGGPADILNLVDIPKVMTGESYQIPYGSEYFKEKLPFAPTTQTGKVAQELGGFVPIDPSKLVKAGVTGAKKAGQYLSPEIADMLEAQMKRSGMIMPIAPEGKPGKAATNLTKEEQDLIDLFNKKAEREAAIAKKVEKQAKAEPKEKGESKGRKGAIAPDYFRTMLKEKGEADVLRAAQAGEHIKRDAYGNYVGFPRHVTSPQALGSMRGSLDQQFSDAVNAIAMSDPDRLGTWYDRAKQGIAMSTEPYQLNRGLEQHGVYSAGVAPESELAFALKHLNSRAVGTPEMAYRGAPMRTLDTAVAENRPAKLGFKIGEYAEKNDPRVPNAGPFGVNDFRAAQGFGYTDPAGDIWKGGVSGTMHPVMDAETALLVNRANQANIGGRSTWAGPHVQEIPWVLGKAQDIYSRGKNARFAGDELEGVKAAIREANNTAQDYMYKHAASATHEAIPGASTGHVPSMLSATPEEKAAYTATGRWDQPPPYSLKEAPTVGAGNRDVLYSALGMRQLPSVESTGAYVNSAGVMEHNPLTISRPLFDFPTGGGGGIAAPQSVKTAEALEKLRAVIDAQEAGALNLPNTANTVKGKNALVLDTRGSQAADPTLGKQPTADQLAAINRELENTGYGATATSRGITIFPYDNDAMGSKELAKLLKSKGSAFQKIYPSKMMKSKNTSIYTPGIGRWGQGGIEATDPFTGEATVAALQEFAGLPPSVARNISESEAVRNAIRSKIERDAAMQGARKDIQNTRNFFAEEDWPKVVELLRKGASPAAALAALGYSLNSLAGERR